LVSGVLDDVHRPDVAYFNEEGDTAGAGESRRNSRRASTVDQPIDDYNDEGFDEDFDMMFDDDVSVCSSSEESEDESEDEEIPDGIILDLYEEVQELRLNPLGLDRFSGEDCKYGGWSHAGIRRFNELYDLVVEDRACPQAAAVEKEFLDYCVKDGNKKKVGGRRSDEPNAVEGSASMLQPRYIRAAWDLNHE
jgi:hypothetical protein